jgi:ABC-type multidrug transport system fused ATPase/permease subunit
MEATFFRYIFRYTWRQQLVILAITFVSFPFLYGSLELPKRIVNEAIGSTAFPKEVYGYQFEQIEYLMTLCLAFLLLVLARFGFRYHLNVYKGQLAERILRRIRYQLFSRILRFPLPHFRKTSQGELIAMITAEVEPLGGFVGEAIALPAFEGGTMVTILVFMFVQDPILGLAAIALAPLQAYVIPKLQRQVNLMAKERVRTARKLSERIGEVVSNIEEVHAHDTAEHARADVARWLGTIYSIRFRIYRKKFAIKFINNIISQLTPFFFFSIGGYLVIKGELTFGALVAVLGAYKDLSAPWKELLNWYQMKEDARVKYDQIVEQFQPAGMLSEEQQAVPEAEVPHLAGRVVCTNLTLEEEGGLKVVDGANCSFEASEKVLLVGPEGSGTGSLCKLIARLLMPTGGSIRVGPLDLATLPQSVTGRRIGYVGQNAAPFVGSIHDNLLYGTRHQPLRSVEYEEDARGGREKYIREARESGNTDSDLAADWIDYDSVGVADEQQLGERIIEVLAVVDLERDIFAFGLQSTLDPEAKPELAANILKARAVLRDRLGAPEYRGLVESFDRAAYNTNMTVAENILFGTPIGPTFDFEHIAENPYMISVLKKVELVEPFLSVGLQAARILVDLFQDVQPGDEIFERFSFLSVEALPNYQAVLRRANTSGLDGLSQADRLLLLSVPFKLVPARHRLGLIDDDALAKLLEARHAFAAGLPEELRGTVAFFDQDRYNAAASVQDNILFGRLVYGRPQSQRVIGELIAEVIRSLGLRRQVIELGLDFSVGIGGSRLTTAQRQKLALARCLLKRPDLLVVDQATAALDPASQRLILAGVLDDVGKAGLLWSCGDAPDPTGFDRMIVMENGRIVGQESLGEDPARKPLAEGAIAGR